jgi:hypothetical protein
MQHWNQSAKVTCFTAEPLKGLMKNSPSSNASLPALGHGACAIDAFSSVLMGDGSTKLCYNLVAGDVVSRHSGRPVVLTAAPKYLAKRWSTSA